MKRCIAVLLLFALCVGLCACGGGEESSELPTRPQQSLPTGPLQNATAEESSEHLDPTGETYPWEAEFNEEDYVKFKFTAPNGDKIITWRVGTVMGMEVREIYEWTDGTISDRYYYPSGNVSHSYTWYPDGSYSERYCRDDGYTDLENEITYMGTVIYEKTIGTDGSESQNYFDESGYVTSSSTMEANGAYSEFTYFDNGNIKYSVYEDAAGNYSEEEYSENGSLKYSKYQSPEYTVEERCDEEGFRIYFYSKNANCEVELIADETGKLIKFTENGTVYENEAIPANIAGDYNFRG